MAREAPDPFQWVGAVVDGKYRVDGVVGEGGFGIVYKGHHLGFEQTVALKCLLVPDALVGEERERFFSGFMAEGRILHQLSRATAGIVQALDVGATTSPSGKWTPYIVLEWLEGRALDKELEQRNVAGFGGRSIVEAIELLDPAARALGVAHEQGVAHRDVKPANLFLAEVGGRRTMKVLDFGIAKVMSQTASLTRAFEATGGSLQAFTPRYGAPEQFSRRYGATGPWTDVFAFALVLVEVITGQPALQGEDTAQLFVAACDPERRPGLLAAGVPAPEQVEAVIQTALSIDPKDRYHSMAEFWDALVLAAGATLDASVGSTPRGPMPSQELGVLERALAATRLATASRPDGTATELSSSRPLLGRDPTERPSIKPARNLGQFAVATLAAASAFAIVAFVGYLIWRPSPEAREALLESAPSASVRPDETVPEQAATPAKSQPSSAERTRESTPRLTAREVPAGKNTKGDLWFDRFRVDQFETRPYTFVDGQKQCASHGMALCSEAQWQRACELHPQVASVRSWTAAAELSGLVLRGGNDCAARQVISSELFSATHPVVCCERAVAVRTEDTGPSLIAIASSKMREFERLTNAHDANAFATFFDDGLIVNRKPKTKRGAVELLGESYRTFPDQFTVIETCSVSLNVVKQTARRRKTKKPRAQTWSTMCEEFRYRQETFAVVTGNYVFSGAAKLKAFGDQTFKREWPKP